MLERRSLILSHTCIQYVVHITTCLARCVGVCARGCLGGLLDDVPSRRLDGNGKVYVRVYVRVYVLRAFQELSYNVLYTISLFF